MLKKALCAFFVFLCLFTLKPMNSQPVFKDFSNEFIIYRNSFSSNCQIIKADYFTSLFIFNKTGESITLKNGEDYDGVLKSFDAEIIFTEHLEDSVEYYAYSEKIKYSILINGKKINLHISVGRTTVIGTPLIFGSF